LPRCIAWDSEGVRLVIADTSPINYLLLTDDIADPLLESLDDGEAAAITPAVAIHADLLLMDDEEGVAAARAKDSRLPAPWAFSAGQPNVN
jgi:predicted nucleic acid-binding protein